MLTSPPHAIDEPNLQRVLLDRYRILRPIGEGGFGRVYEARDEKTRELVALKIGRGSTHGLRMEREARLAALLKSPHSVRVLGFERLADGSPVIIMELLRGISLRQHLALCGRVHCGLAVVWALQLAEALREAHDIGLVHRDVKPSNLFVEESMGGEPQIKLLDFGLARTQTSTGEATVTGSELILGSPAYMSPEQLRTGKVSTVSDIWSFGVVLYEILVGHRPFRAESNSGLLAAIAADAPELLPLADLSVPSGLPQLIERCLRKNPAERFAKMSDVICALHQLGDVTGGALATDTEVTDETIAAPRRDRRRLSLSLLKPSGLLFGMTLALGAWAGKSIPRPSGHTASPTETAGAISDAVSNSTFASLASYDEVPSQGQAPTTEEFEVSSAEDGSPSTDQETRQGHGQTNQPGPTDPGPRAAHPSHRVPSTDYAAQVTPTTASVSSSGVDGREGKASTPGASAREDQRPFFAEPDF